MGRNSIAGRCTYVNNLDQGTLGILAEYRNSAISNFTKLAVFKSLLIFYSEIMGRMKEKYIYIIFSSQNCPYILQKSLWIKNSCFLIASANCKLTILSTTSRQNTLEFLDIRIQEVKIH